MKTRRSGAGVLAGIFVVAVALSARAIGATDVSSTLHAAIQQRATEAVGFTVFDRNRTQSIQFPGHSGTKVLDVSKARRGTDVFSVVIRSFNKNGDAVSTDERTSFQTELNKSPIPETAYELPIALDREADFTFTAPRHCAECDEAVDQIDFRAKVRGENNADGSIFVDTKSHDIVRVDYTPVVLPKPASHAT